MGRSEAKLVDALQALYGTDGDKAVRGSERRVRVPTRTENRRLAEARYRVARYESSGRSSDVADMPQWMRQDIATMTVMLGEPRLNGWVMGRYVVEQSERGRVLRDLVSGAEARVL